MNSECKSPFWGSTLLNPLFGQLQRRFFEAESFHVSDHIVRKCTRRTTAIQEAVLRNIERKVANICLSNWTRLVCVSIQPYVHVARGHAMPLPHSRSKNIVWWFPLTCCIRTLLFTRMCRPAAISIIYSVYLWSGSYTEWRPEPA